MRICKVYKIQQLKDIPRVFKLKLHYRYTGRREAARKLLTTLLNTIMNNISHVSLKISENIKKIIKGVPMFIISQNSIWSLPTYQNGLTLILFLSKNLI